MCVVWLLHIAGARFVLWSDEWPVPLVGIQDALLDLLLLSQGCEAGICGTCDALAKWSGQRFGLFCIFAIRVCARK